MILIADSGSTKTDWTILSKEASPPYPIYHTVGFNPYFIDTNSIVDEIQSSLIPNLPKGTKVFEIYFYGAGASSRDKQQVVVDALRQVFLQATHISVSHDLLGSARALLGKESGFAAILGTGTNTCIYDGIECVKNIDSLGYLLGDEGSGAYLGKKIIVAYMRNQFDEELKNAFESMYGLHTTSAIISELYAHRFPNRWLATFARFAGDFYNHEIIKRLVMDSFTDFFEELVSKYPNYTNYTFNCVGSIAHYFKQELIAVASLYNMQVGKIIASPIQALAAYHAQ
jgi:glucosamine kinase